MKGKEEVKGKEEMKSSMELFLIEETAEQRHVQRKLQKVRIPGRFKVMVGDGWQGVGRLWEGFPVCSRLLMFPR